MSILSVMAAPLLSAMNGIGNRITCGSDRSAHGMKAREYKKRKVRLKAARASRRINRKGK